MAARTFEASSAGIGSRRLDDEFPSDSANSPEEGRDTSPLDLAASTPARLSQQSKTRLRTTLRDSPARPGHSDTRTGLFGRFSPARDWSTVRRRAPSYHALRARDLDDDDDQDVPAFTPLPPPRLFVPQDPLRPGQLFREDRASSLISSRPRVSHPPTTWSPLFRARQHYPPTKAELTSAFETSRPHDYEFEPDSRVEAWLENVRPDRFEATHVLSSLRDLHLSRHRRDGIVEPDVHHATPRGALPTFEASEGGQTQLPPCSPQQHFSPSPIRGYPRIHRPPSAIPAPQTPLTHHHHHHRHLIPHTTSSPTHPHHRRPGTAFSSPPAPSAPEDDNEPGHHRSDHASASTSAASLSSPSRDSVPPQPCITLSPPPSQQQQQRLTSSSPRHDQYRGHVAARVVHPSPPSPPLLYSRRRPRQRGPAPAPALIAPAVVTMPTTGDAGHVPVTPEKAVAAPAAAAARKSRFGGGGYGDGQDGGGGGGGEDDGRAEESMLSPDVYLWRGDSERRARFREMIRQRCASYGDRDIGDVEEGGG